MKITDQRSIEIIKLIDTKPGEIFVFDDFKESNHIFIMSDEKKIIRLDNGIAYPLSMFKDQSKVQIVKNAELILK